jgi:hypothetical protein
MKEKKVIKVSFDVDGTLNKHFDGGINPYEDAIRRLFVELVGSDDYDVYIITRRYGPEHANEGIKNEHATVFEMLEKLNIVLPKEKILFTNRKYKYSYINQLGIDIHLDDDSHEHDLINRFTTASSIDVQKPDWREKFDELL